MTIDAKHPDYSARLPDWEQMLDTLKGERAVKERAERYLPPTKGMIDAGYYRITNANADVIKAYEAYKVRARFSAEVRDTAVGLYGLMQRKTASIQVPRNLEPMLNVATVEGESAVTLHGRINEAQLGTGRIGLLLDPVRGAAVGVPPKIATYTETAILDWDEEVNQITGVKRLVFLVLDESAHGRRSLDGWRPFIQRTRVCRLVEGVYQTAVSIDRAPIGDAGWLVPTIGGKPMDEVPFVVVNVTSIKTMCPDIPLLLGLSDAVLARYRKTADYEQHLHEQGQDTLAAYGVDLAKQGPIAMGTGAVLNDLPVNAKVEYVGINSNGLPEQRESLRDITAEIAAMSTGLVDTKGAGVEAAETLRMRVSARLAKLVKLADAGAEGLAETLRMAARWMGADPAEVKVTPNYDFDASVAPMGELLQLIAAKMQGAAVTWEDIYAVMQRMEVVPAERTFEETKALLDEEAMEGGTGAARTDIDPLGGKPAPEPPKPGDPDPEDDEDQGAAGRGRAA